MRPGRSRSVMTRVQLAPALSHSMAASALGTSATWCLPPLERHPDEATRDGIVVDDEDGHLTASSLLSGSPAPTGLRPWVAADPTTGGSAASRYRCVGGVVRGVIGRARDADAPGRASRWLAGPACRARSRWRRPWSPEGGSRAAPGPAASDRPSASPGRAVRGARRRVRVRVVALARTSTAPSSERARARCTSALATAEAHRADLARAPLERVGGALERREVVRLDGVVDLVDEVRRGHGEQRRQLDERPDAVDLERAELAQDGQVEHGCSAPSSRAFAHSAGWSIGPRPCGATAPPGSAEAPPRAGAWAARRASPGGDRVAPGRAARAAAPGRVAPSRPEVALEDVEQVVALDGLGEVVVHPGLDAPLAVARHRVRGHRDDRHARPALGGLAGADAARRLEPVELGHLAVHEHEVVPRAAERLERLDAVLRPRPRCSRGAPGAPSRAGR